MSKKIMNVVKRLLQCFRFFPVSILLNWNDDKTLKDVERWKKIHNLECSNYVAFSILLWNYPEFRNLLVYRNRFRRVYRNWIKLWYKPMNTLFIEAKEIGGGLYIQHGFATMISAVSIGENCWINQQVTIGYKGNTNPPKIGNNVTITCGAKVLGDITIGDNVIVGANAVVIKDVESGVTVGGIPAKRIK